MAEELVLCEVAEGIATLTLNYPERRNPLSTPLMTALKMHLDGIKKNRAARVVILRSTGTVFCSGHDLNELRGGTQQEYDAIFDLCTEVMEAIRLLPQPVIAEVDGLATAAGCQLVATCDLAVVSEGSTFVTPGVRGGLFCTTPAVAIARAVGTKKAMEMLLTAETVSAEDALKANLVNRVVPSAEVRGAARALAEQIAKASAYSVSLGKAAFYRQVQMERSEAYAYASKVMVENLMAPDAQEGIEAFFEKRPPKWDQ